MTNHKPTNNGDHDQSERSSSTAVEYKEVEGSVRNISRYGLPSDRSNGRAVRYYLFPTWRSQLFSLIGFLASSIGCVISSHYLPMSVLPGKLFEINDTVYVMHLPLFSVVPGFLLAKVLIIIYDARYILDDRGVEAQVGLVSLSLRQPKIRYEDIRGVEPKQSIIERILGIGSVLVGSAMTGDVEIIMNGVKNPRAVQLLINAERDMRQNEFRYNPSAGE